MKIIDKNEYCCHLGLNLRARISRKHLVARDPGNLIDTGMTGCIFYKHEI